MKPSDLFGQATNMMTRLAVLLSLGSQILPPRAWIEAAQWQQQPAADSLAAATSQSVTLIAAGGYHTCALTSTGGVKCWGHNWDGQLGDGTYVNRYTPVNVVGLASDVTGIAGGGHHTCAVTGGGGVKCWGNNSVHQLGDGTIFLRNTPVDVVGLATGVTEIIAGYEHTCALTSGGGAKCWGNNERGQLGDGTTTRRSTPVDVSGLTSGVTGLTAYGGHTCALTSGGGVKCWGNNERGQLGDGTTTNRSTPVDVSGLTSGVHAIAAGSQHTCALTSGGGVKCWGANFAGQLGDGTTTSHVTPVDVIGLTSGVTAIVAGHDHTCALIDGGGAKCWGDNWYSQLGDGTTTDRVTPVDVSGLTSGVTQLSTGGCHSCALISEGGAKCWGRNESGQVGDGTTIQRLTPVEVSGMGIPPARIADLTATPGTYPGDITLRWTAPGDDGNTGTASLYEVRQESVRPIETEHDWEIATIMEGAPTPLAAGTTQSMAVSLMPGGTSYFAIKARDEAGNWSDLSNSPSAKTPGRLVSDINWELKYSPSTILDEEVTVLVIPVRTDDFTLLGGIGPLVGTLHFVKEIGKGAVQYIFAKGGTGGAVALKMAAGVALGFCIGENILGLRAQLVWGLHGSEQGDPTLLVWDSGVHLDMGVPYVVTGTIHQWETSLCQLWLPLDDFYYLRIESGSDVQKHEPSSADPHLPIPTGYEYLYWHDLLWDELVGYGEQICTIGLVTERYPVGGHDYVRIQLMERWGTALPVRVPAGEAAPDMGTMALFCGTKRAAGGDDLHPGDLPLARYLDTTTGDGHIEIVQGTESDVVRHEGASVTQMQIETGSPVDIHVYDLEGNHVGVLYDGNGTVIGMESDIADVEYFYGVDDAPEFMSISNPTAGAYTVTIRGTDTGTYTQTVHIYSSGRETYTSTVAAQPTYAGKEDTIIVDEIPAAPIGLEVSVDGTTVNLDWNDNTESDLAGYNVYRSTRVDGVYQKMNSSLLSASSSTDSSTDEYTAYYYYVTAEDTDHNESGHLTPIVSRYLTYLPRVLRNH